MNKTMKILGICLISGIIAMLIPTTWHIVLGVVAGTFIEDVRKGY